MCGCKAHYDRTALCACTCPEHAQWPGQVRFPVSDPQQLVGQNLRVTIQGNTANFLTTGHGPPGRVQGIPADFWDLTLSDEAAAELLPATDEEIAEAIESIKRATQDEG